MFSHSLASCVEMSPSYLDEEMLHDSPLLPAAQHHAREGGRSPR